MKPRNVIYSLLAVIAMLALAINVWRNEPKRKEAFDRTPEQLAYTKHAKCRMECREITEEEIREVLEKGMILFNRSNRNDKPCPTFALQRRTSKGASLRVIFAQCNRETRVVTCYNLEKEFSCDCP
ncbi:MAG: DUF4258 domain-containing protein [Flavisolibacter sp.]|jgi:hypothetical protein|nr:DUF4258 domain-containing protein [Flavisolibacter sp.]